MELSAEERYRLARGALDEDLGWRGDITSDNVIPEETEAAAYLVAREDLVLAGLPMAREVFHILDPELRFAEHCTDGDAVPAGRRVATVEGRARALLAGERTALNFLMRMSGVATMTRRCVDEVAGTGVQVLDTRKTIPGLRRIDKYAVVQGGGVNHRMGLHDAAMIKDTHLGAMGNLEQAVRSLRAAGIETERITAEVRDLDELDQAIRGGAGRALLDNMDLDELRRAVAHADGRIVLEASGGLRPGNLREVAETGVDCMSLGFLTHSAPAADLAMDLEVRS